MRSRAIRALARVCFLSSLALSSLAMSSLAHAQAAHVLVVPANPSDLSIPPLAPAEARITLKAVIRDATCSSGYSVVWDLDGDGVFDTAPRTYAPDTAARAGRDIGVARVAPQVATRTLVTPVVRATDLCTGEASSGVFPVLVYDFEPSADPRLWTDLQLEVMRVMAVQEALWYVHRRVTCTGADTATIQGQLSSNEPVPLALALFARNGRLPAYPPETVNEFGGPLPTGWEQENN